MGNKSLSPLERFKAEHPMCCFCGGETRTTSKDHIPSRQFFHNRQWPVGQVFPACDECNQSTKGEEQVAAMLSRLYPDGDTDQQKKEVIRDFQGVSNNYPNVLIEMEATARQRRDWLKKRSIERNPNTPLSDVPVMNVSGPIVNHCVTVFGRKLMLALHYKHTNRIVPSDGGIVLRWYSNEVLFEGEPLTEAATTLVGMPKLERNAMPLDGQFSYKYGHTSDGEISGFIASFRLSFAIAGFVRLDGRKFERLDGLENVEIHRPFGRS